MIDLELTDIQQWLILMGITLVVWGYFMWRQK